MLSSAFDINLQRFPLDSKSFIKECNWLNCVFLIDHTGNAEIDGLVQERHNSSVLAVELRLSCINPSKWYIMQTAQYVWGNCKDKINFIGMQLLIQAIDICFWYFIWYCTILPISFRVISQALGQSYDCPSAREATLKDMGQICLDQTTTKCNKAKQNHLYISWNILKRFPIPRLWYRCIGSSYGWPRCVPATMWHSIVP